MDLWGETTTSSIHVHPNGKDAAQAEGFHPKTHEAEVSCIPYHPSSPDTLELPATRAQEDSLGDTWENSIPPPSQEPIGTARVAVVPWRDSEGQGSCRQAPASPPMRAL